jgi:hypothetical protein
VVQNNNLPSADAIPSMALSSPDSVTPLTGLSDPLADFFSSLLAVSELASPSFLSVLSGLLRLALAQSLSDPNQPRSAFILNPLTGPRAQPCIVRELP